LVNEPAFREIPRIAAGDASHSLIDRARSLVAAGDAPEIHQACAEVFAADPEAYRSYLAGLRTGGGAVDLVEAEDFTESGPELVEAIAERIEERGRDVVAAGDADTLDDGIRIALERNPKLYERLLGAQAETAGER